MMEVLQEQEEPKISAVQTFLYQFIYFDYFYSKIVNNSSSTYLLAEIIFQ